MRQKPSTNTIIGELSLHYEGYGFVIPSKMGESDVFIPARSVGDALHGDRVEAAVREGRKGLREGAILKVLERRLKQIVGRLEQQGKNWTVISEDQRVRHRLQLKNVPKGFRHGEYVVARITRYPAANLPMEGEVIEKLPKRGTLQAEVEYVIAKHQWPKHFPTNVEESASFFDPASGRQAGLKMSGEAGNSRKDLRSLQFVTIDGIDAKDFDDAVHASPVHGGHIRLWVAIADVSHYVAPDSPIDKEAYSRSTSVYFPGRVLPMLPEVLSNNLCSLRPHEERLAMVAEMEIDRSGHVVKESFYPAVFQSQARLTYTLVRRMIVDKEEGLRADNPALIPMLETLSEAASRLKAVRARRGSVDFDLPEPEIVLDLTGGIENIEKAERNWSHQIIEELMIAANEAVARFLTQKKVGCVYRIHDGPDPDKIRNFYKMVQILGYRGRFSFPVSSGTLMHVLGHFKGHTEVRLVNSVMLRSMSQAVYSARNIGHFGLASDCYCHFTSPIRRYPDLIVHRLLKQALGMPRISHAAHRTPHSAQLEEMAEHCSRLERRAMEAEREMVALHKALFLQDKVGEAFDGIISHVTKFGFFVELLDYFVEGLVPVQSLAGDFFVFDEAHFCLRGKKRKTVYKIGLPVRVMVQEVNIPERRTYFDLIRQ